MSKSTLLLQPAYSYTFQIKSFKSNRISCWYLFCLTKFLFTAIMENYNRMHKKIIYLTIVVMVITGCKNVQQGIFSKQSPHEEYLLKLEEAGIDNYKLGKIWVEAADKGLLDPVDVGIPFSEAIVFDWNKAPAASYKLFLREGQNLHVLVEPELFDTTHIFIDIFQYREDELIRVAFAEKDSLRHDYNIRRDGEYLVRIQPELMAQGLFTVYLFTNSSLNFPVPDKDFNSISSFFGDPRDGGRRFHEGVDVFAPRGTPALAVGPGRVTRTGTNRLGGKVIWVSDTDKEYNYYYAHLDSQLVRPGMRVNPGDTLGFIGNTGNAVTTPPHLHFGIYALGRRSIDPYVFFHQTEMQLIDSIQIKQLSGKWATTTAQKSNFRNAPAMDARVDTVLTANTPVFVKGISGEWLRVELPEGTGGFLHNSLVESFPAPIREYQSVTRQIIRTSPLSLAPAKGIIDSGETIPIYNEYNSWQLVLLGNEFGWIESES